MGFGEVAMAALYFVLRFGLTFSDRLGGVLFCLSCCFFAQWPNADSTTHPTGEPPPPANTGNWANRPTSPAYIPQGQGYRCPEAAVRPEKGSACPQESATLTGIRHCPPPGCIPE